MLIFYEESRPEIEGLFVYRDGLIPNCMRQLLLSCLENSKTHLQDLTPRMIAELTTVIQGDWGLMKNVSPGQVHLLDIEIFVDSYSLVLYPMDKRNTQLGHRRLLQEFPDGILYGDELTPDLADFDFNNEAHNQELNKFDRELKEIFLAWFIACWNKTDRTMLSKPIYLMEHDTDTSLDLLTSKWVSNEVKLN